MKCKRGILIWSDISGWIKILILLGIMGVLYFAIGDSIASGLEYIKNWRLGR